MQETLQVPGKQTTIQEASKPIPEPQQSGPNVVIPGMPKSFPAQQRNINARLVRNMDISQAYAFQSRRKLHTKSQLRRLTMVVNPTQMRIPTVMTVLYCTR